MKRSGGFSALESRLVGKRERVEERGWRGIYTHTPKSDRCVFSGGTRIIRGTLGSSGVLTERTKHTLKFLGPDHPVQDRIIRPGQLWTLTSHQVRIIRTYSETFCTVGPDHPTKSWNLVLRLIFVGVLSQELYFMWSILTTKNLSECVPFDSTVNPILKFKPKIKLNPDWIHHTNFEIGDLPFIFFLNFSFYSCTHFLQSIISPNLWLSRITKIN